MNDSPPAMHCIHTIAELEALRDRLGPLACVPTMGALHAGHLSLIEEAALEGLPVVVTVFVNPTQFDAPNDLARYPRTLDVDCSAARAAGASIVFAPEVETVYPPGEPMPVPPLPAVATEPELEDAYRPGHFAGVCQVVARLFDLIQPATAIFGEKDYQQLLVIRAMAAAASERWPALRIDSGRTVREPDGLAMSSRNVFLDASERERARGISRALQAAHAAQRPATAERIMVETLRSHDLTIDYAVVRDAGTLMPVETFDHATRGLIAARVGSVRLIDNRAMPVW